MFRLSTTDEDGATVFTMDGQLLGEYTKFIEESCDSAAKTGKRVHLHLRDVSAIDEGGRSLLGRLANKGVEIRASGIYTSYVVQALNREASERMTSIHSNARARNCDRGWRS